MVSDHKRPVGVVGCIGQHLMQEVDGGPVQRGKGFVQQSQCCAAGQSCRR